MQTLFLKIIESLFGWRLAFGVACKITSSQLLKAPSSLAYILLRKGYAHFKFLFNFVSVLRLALPQKRGENFETTTSGLKVYISSHWTEKQVDLIDKYFEDRRIKYAYLSVDVAQQEALKAARGRVISVTDVWTDHEADLEVHTQLEHTYNECRQRFSAARKNGIELFPLVRILFSQFFVFVHRFEQMLALAVREGVEVAVVCQSRSMSIEAISSIIGDKYPLVSLQLSRFTKLNRVVSVRCGQERPYFAALFSRWLRDDAAQSLRESSKQSRKIARQLLKGDVVAVTDIIKPDLYWKANFSVFRELEKRKIPFVIATSDARIKFSALLKGWKVAMPVTGLSELAGSNNSALREYFRLADEYVALQREAGAPAAGLLDKRLIISEWLASRDRLPEVLISQLVAEQFRIALSSGTVKSALVLPHWAYLANILTVVARTVGIRIVSAPLVSVAGNKASIVGWESISDIGCYGRQCQDAFSKLGTDQNKLHLIGNLSLDRLVTLSEKSAKRNLRGVLIAEKPNKKIILVATSRIDVNENKWIEHLVRHCKSRGDCRVVVKIHPSFSEHAYSNIHDANDKSLCQVIKNADIYDLIVASRVCVTDYSTVGAEAVIAGKHLIVVNMTNKKFPANDYVEMGVATGVSSMNDLNKVFDSILDGGDVSPALHSGIANFVRAYNHKNDGKAASRLVDLIISKG